MPRTVVFHVFCPGTLFENVNGEILRARVTRTANHNLGGIFFDAAFYGDQRSTQEVVEHVLRVRMQTITAKPREAFSVQPYNTGAIGAELEHLTALIGDGGTAEDWLDAFSYGKAIAARIAAGFESIADTLALTNLTRTTVPWQVLVSLPTPFIGLAAVDPSIIPPIQAGSMMRYTLQDTAFRWRLISSVHLPHPLTFGGPK